MLASENLFQKITVVRGSDKVRISICALIYIVSDVDVI
jgi:hypothetical protein